MSIKERLSESPVVLSSLLFAELQSEADRPSPELSRYDIYGSVLKEALLYIGMSEADYGEIEGADGFDFEREFQQGLVFLGGTGVVAIASTPAREFDSADSCSYSWGRAYETVISGKTMDDLVTRAIKWADEMCEVDRRKYYEKELSE